MAIVDSFRLVFRDSETDGVPATGAHEPVKSEIRALGGVIQQSIDLIANGIVIGGATTYATKAAMDAAYATGAVGRLALVYADSTASNNKIWVKGSSVWVDAGMTLAASAVAQLTDFSARITAIEAIAGLFPYAVADGSGTVDALILTPTPAVTSLRNGSYVYFRVNGPNTGAVTINVSGLGVKDLRGMTGGSLVANDLQVGRVYAARYTGARWDLVAGSVGEYSLALANISQVRRITLDPSSTSDVLIGTTPGYTGTPTQQLQNGSLLILRPTLTSTTTTPSLQLSGDTVARPIRDASNVALKVGDLIADRDYLILPDGGRYRLLNPGSSMRAADVTAAISAAVAALVGGASTAADTLKKVDDRLTSEITTRGNSDAGLQAQITPLTTKVSGIANGATANATDAALRDRATHTGAQAVSTVTGLQTALDAKAAATALTAEVSRATSAEAALAGGVTEALSYVTPFGDLLGDANDRPGDAKSLFTTTLTGDPKSRPAITKGTIVNGGALGQALRIAGPDADPVAGYVDVAPKKIFFIEEGRTYLVHYSFARSADPVDPEQNAVELRVQNMSSTFASVSNARLGATLAPLVADGVQTFRFLIGKVGAPGTLDYTIPPTARYFTPHIRIFGNGQQTDVGAIRSYEVTEYALNTDQLDEIEASIAASVAAVQAAADEAEAATVAAEAAQAAAEAAAASFIPTVEALADGTEVPTAAGLRFAALNAAGDVIQLITWDNLFTSIEDRLMPPTHNFDASGTVGTTAQMLVFNDDGLQSVNVQNLSLTATMGIAPNGRTPVIGSSGTYTLKPLGIASFKRGDGDFIPGSMISIIADSSGVPFTAGFCTLTDYDPNVEGPANSATNAHLARYTGTLSSTAEDAVRTLYKKLYAGGIIPALGPTGGFYLGYAPNEADAMMNWLGNHHALTKLGNPVFTPWNGWQFSDGNALNTGLLISSVAGQNDHTMFCIADMTSQASGHYLVGDERTKITPNLSGGSRFRTADHNAQTNDTFADAGGLHVVTRIRSDRYVASRKKVAESYSDAANLVSLYPVWLGAQQSGPSGPSAFYQGRGFGGGVGRYITNSQRNLFSDALDEFVAAVPGF